MADIVKKEYALTEAETSEKKDKVINNHQVSLDSVLVRKILKLAFKLALGGVYNEKLNLIINGSEIKRANLVKYLILAVSDRKSVIAWPPSLLTILRRSNIVPTDVMNESLKKLLVPMHKKKTDIIDNRFTPSYSYPISFPNIHVDTQTPHNLLDLEPAKKTRKRKLVDADPKNIRYSDRIAQKKKKIIEKNGGVNPTTRKSQWTRISE